MPLGARQPGRAGYYCSITVPLVENTFADERVFSDVLAKTAEGSGLLGRGGRLTPMRRNESINESLMMACQVLGPRGANPGGKAL